MADVSAFCMRMKCKGVGFSEGTKLLRHTGSPGAPSLTDLAVFSCAQFVILCFVFSGESVTPFKQ